MREKQRISLHLHVTFIYHLQFTVIIVKELDCPYVLATVHSISPSSPSITDVISRVPSRLMMNLSRGKLVPSVRDHDTEPAGKLILVRHSRVTESPAVRTVG